LIKSKFKFNFRFEESVIKDIYINQLNAVRKILNGNNLECYDKILSNHLIEQSQHLIKKFEKESDPSTVVKANLSPIANKILPNCEIDKKLSEVNKLYNFRLT
jgi:hypothetical protein